MLVGCDLRGANLMAADLDGADLTRANLHGADLTNANLRSANLTGAIDPELQRALFLEGATLRTAQSARRPMPRPGVGS